MPPPLVALGADGSPPLLVPPRGAPLVTRPLHVVRIHVEVIAWLLPRHGALVIRPPPRLHGDDVSFLSLSPLALVTYLINLLFLYFFPC